MPKTTHNLTSRRRTSDVRRENKAIVHRLMEEVWTNGDLSLVDQLISVNYKHHDTSTPDFGPGPEGKGRERPSTAPRFPTFNLLLRMSSPKERPYPFAGPAKAPITGRLAGLHPRARRSASRG